MAGSLPRNRGNRSTARVGSAVSRKLRTAGFNVSPSARRHRYNGLFVSGKDRMATILVDLGVPAKNERTAHEIIGEVMGWPTVESTRTPRKTVPSSSG